jgi:hypothetical protein
VLPTASTTILGGVRVDGSSVLINDLGIISAIGGEGGGGGGGPGLPEAPLDGPAYGRQLATWQPVIAHHDDVVDGGSF